jgi:spore coat polysaccharide biosynthesis predicted glycosyltransferase SpsG
MRFVLRTDVTKSSGAGHLMRCIAIFEQIKQRGYPSVFVGSFSDIAWTKQKVIDFGFGQIVDNPTDFVGNPDSDVLILDSYLIPIDDPFLSKHLWKKIIAISDEQTPDYKVDLIVHPTLKQVIKSDYSQEVLFGPAYFPIRNEIRKIESLDSKFDKVEVLILGGGTDYENFSEVIAKNLMNIETRFAAKFISDNQSIEQMDARFEVFGLGTPIESLISQCTLALTTASTSAVEFIAREVPTGIVRAVDNQSEYFDYLSSQNLAMPIGERRDSLWLIDNRAISDLIGNLSSQNTLRLNMAGLIDLKGSERILDKILHL